MTAPANIEISATDSKAHGLPACKLTFVNPGAWMRIVRFPRPGCYVTFSGPQGGTLMFSVWASEGTQVDTDAAEREARRVMHYPGEQPISVHDRNDVEINGAPSAAVSLVSGGERTKAACLAAIVPTSQGVLLVLMKKGPIVDGESCSDLAHHPPFATLLKGFSLGQ
jgi:hypothetical protein